MGCGRKNQDAAWRSEKPAYTYWSGVDAYRSPRAAKAEQAAKAKATPAFPGYDVVAADNAEIT